MFERIKNIFNRGGSNPPPAPAPKKKSKYLDTVTWRVPKGTKKVTVAIYNEDGSYVNHYVISKYMTLKAGQKLILFAE